MIDNGFHVKQKRGLPNRRELCLIKKLIGKVLLEVLGCSAGGFFF